jgi:glycosyltransferase involved in cell wall biosynthesis
MSAARLLVNASNLMHGGAVQVAASFIDELWLLRRNERILGEYPWLEHGMQVEASSQVIRNLGVGRGLECLRQCDAKGVGLRRGRGSPPSTFDVSFTLFGPDYGKVRAGRRIVGFADGTSLADRDELTTLRTIGERLKWRVRRRISRRLFVAADHVIVEAQHTADALVTRWGLESARISVVPNSVNALLADYCQERAEQGPAPTEYLVCYVAKPYPHKNFALLPAVADALMASHGIQARFVLTLTPKEWASQSTQLRTCSVNAGPVSVDQLAALYRGCAASIFPSLLESFSITPLEALATETPLAAADRGFVREVAGDCAIYFDPEDPLDAATALARVLRDGYQHVRVSSGKRRANAWPNAGDRALDYVRIIDHEMTLAALAAAPEAASQR